MGAASAAAGAASQAAKATANLVAGPKGDAAVAILLFALAALAAWLTFTRRWGLVGLALLYPWDVTGGSTAAPASAGSTTPAAAPVQVSAGAGAQGVQ